MSLSYFTAAEPGKPVIEGYGPSIKLYKNSSLSLNCTSCGGYPYPRTQFFIHTTEVSQDEVIYIQNENCTTGSVNITSMFDNDNITCMADNRFGSPSTENITVTIDGGEIYLAK